jgi:hypothetical protein
MPLKSGDMTGRRKNGIFVGIMLKTSFETRMGIMDPSA